MRPIPFNLPDVGFREIGGKVYLEDGFLVIRLSNALFGEFDKEKREIRIEPAALSQVRLDEGLLRDKFVLRPLDNRLLDAIPGDYDLEVELQVWRNRRTELQMLVRELIREMDSE